jgi:acyl carrier protein
MSLGDQDAVEPPEHVTAGDQTNVSLRVRELLAETLNVPGASIGSEFSAASAPAWTSLTHLMLISQIENEFGVYFTNQEIPRLTSFDQVVQAVMKHLSDGA